MLSEYKETPRHAYVNKVSLAETYHSVECCSNLIRRLTSVMDFMRISWYFLEFPGRTVI